MKRYIRTKDGRIVEIKDNMVVKQSDVLRLVYKDRPYICVLNGNDEIVNQADNIEELIDEFILCVNNGKNNYHYCKSLNVAIRKKRDMTYCAYAEKQVSIIGAIWTDKGLIYIAKMNEKGEWELL